MMTVVMMEIGSDDDCGDDGDRYKYLVVGQQQCVLV